MTDDQIGSVGEEAAKLLAALQDWARQSGQEHAAQASSAAGGVAASLRGVNEHVGHGPDCRYCPVCQAINLVRETSPEVRQHLALAASSLLQAVQGMLASQVPEDHRSRRDEPVERINLDDDGSWDDE
jgi:hypothetical protein